VSDEELFLLKQDMHLRERDHKQAMRSCVDAAARTNEAASDKSIPLEEFSWRAAYEEGVWDSLHLAMGRYQRACHAYWKALGA